MEWRGYYWELNLALVKGQRKARTVWVENGQDLNKWVATKQTDLNQWQKKRARWMLSGRDFRAACPVFLKSYGLLVCVSWFAWGQEQCMWSKGLFALYGLILFIFPLCLFPIPLQVKCFLWMILAKGCSSFPAFYGDLSVEFASAGTASTTFSTFQGLCLYLQPGIVCGSMKAWMTLEGRSGSPPS